MKHAAQPVTDAPRAVKIFGREPALILGAIEAALFLAVSGLAYYGKLDLDVSGFIVIAMAVVSGLVGVYTAIATKDQLLGVMTGFVKAIINGIVYFGLDFPLELQAATLSFVALAVGVIQRDRTSPVAEPVDPSPQQVEQSPLPGVAAPVMTGGNPPTGGAEVYAAPTPDEKHEGGSAYPLQ